ncbi:hypothetical protein ACQPZP_03425 [Spirillospora sp. CA-142024]|uniref:hypothetical protein n=1 Tax=Spirillospora sp. CA-142024 TaxID=3240036 RepID=UPI003D93E2C1
MVVFANSVGVVNGYMLAVTGVTKNIGPVTTAFVIILSGTPVFWYVYKPELRSRWFVWKQALLMGVALGVNNMCFQTVLRWVRLAVVEPLSFLCTAAFMIGGVVVEDVRSKKYSTVLWPVLAGLGIWALATDTAEGKGGGVFTKAIPQIHVLDHRIPGWILGVGLLLSTAGTYAFLQWRLEVVDNGIKGKANTLAGIPGVAILAVGVWAMEGSWGGVTISDWPYLLACVANGVLGALLGGVVLVKAYEHELRASTTAMLLPLRTLLGTSLGMAVEQVAPGPLGLVAIVSILVGSYGAAKIQSRKKAGSG